MSAEHRVLCFHSLIKYLSLKVLFTTSSQPAARIQASLWLSAAAAAVLNMGVESLREVAG